jgi:hypothetical protein
MLVKALKVFREAQENPDLAFEFSELAGYMDSEVIETVFIYAFLKGWKEGKEIKEEES